MNNPIARLMTFLDEILSDLLSTSAAELRNEAIEDGEDIEAIHRRVQAAMANAVTAFHGRPDTDSNSLEQQLRALMASATTATALPPDARWLIAARLLMRKQPPGMKFCVVLGVSSYHVKKVFGTWGMGKSALYRREDAPGQNDVAEFVYRKILSSLNAQYAEVRGRLIGQEEFLQAPVPVDVETVQLGNRAIQWFTQWLMYGVGTASRASASDLLRREIASEPATQSDELTKQLVLRALDEHDQRLRCIINVHSHESAAKSRLLARNICKELLDRHASVVYMSLDHRTTRQQVLRGLYETFGLSTEPLQELRHRPANLAIDLEPVRKALTIAPIVIIFDGWDNGPGSPFMALREFLCDTNWDEFLRVLAQPHEPTLLAASGRLEPQYSLLVLSTCPVVELAPWARFITSRAADQRVLLHEGRIDPRGTDSINPHWRSLLEILAVRLIAASINGMRAETLQRCISEWLRMFHDSKRDERDSLRTIDIAAWIHGLFENPGDDLETRIDVTADGSEAHTVVDFVSRSCRSTFVARWLDQDSVSGASNHRCSWAHINFVLAEESLRQVAIQLRHHFPWERTESSHILRGTMQAICHGLMSLDVSAEAFSHDVDAALPKDADRRYRYLYLHLYRQLVKDNQWQLGSCINRPGVWLDLLILFVSPRVGSHLLTGPEHVRTVELLRFSESAGFIPQQLRANPQLRSELLLAIGQAGCDLGGEDGHRAVHWASRLLNERPIEIEALKLSLDWVRPDSSAAQRCWEQLQRLGVDRTCFDTLRADVNLTTAWRSKLKAVSRMIERRVESPARLGWVADILCRLGSIEAMRIDDAIGGESPPLARSDMINVLSSAFALYWIADRLRTSDHSVRSLSRAWSEADAHHGKHYVSACLRLGSLLAESPDTNPPDRKLIAGLLEHAQHRLGVLTRHHCHLRRERNEMLLLEVSRLRTWMWINLTYATRDLRKEYEDYRHQHLRASVEAHARWIKSANEYLKILGDAEATLARVWELLREAEDALLSLGFHPALTRRLYLTRIEAITALIKLALAYPNVHKKPPETLLVQIDVRLNLTAPASPILQEICKDHPRWKNIIEQQTRHLDRTRQAWLTFRRTLV